MKKKLFGTDGIRGVAGVFPMDTKTAFAVGKAIVERLYEDGSLAPKIVIGRDTRESGKELEEALCAGIMLAKGEVHTAEVIPTSAVAYLTRAVKADMGIMISASHNPYTDNGIKLFDANGYKLTDEAQGEIEELIFSELEKTEKIEACSAAIIGDAMEKYVGFLEENVDFLSLKKMNVALDCANGASFEVAPALFSRLGAKLEIIGVEPNGKNINEKVGSEHPEKLIEIVREKKCDVGLAFDGDADRLVAVDETGALLTGDHILCICANYLKSEGILKNETIVCTVMSNLGFHEAMQKNDIRVITSDVGDRSVLLEMLKAGAVIGGEDSGHLIYLDIHTTGDGLIAAILLLSAMGKSKKPLSELRKQMNVFPQIVKNVPIRERKEWQKIHGLPELVENIEKKLGGKGRVLIRYSGTQNICRIMVEGPNLALIEQMTDEIANLIQKEIGVLDK